MVREIRFFFSPPPAAMAARGSLISLNSPEVNSGEFKGSGLPAGTLGAACAASRLRRGPSRLVQPFGFFMVREIRFFFSPPPAAMAAQGASFP